jgi:hypothetical protein
MGNSENGFGGGKVGSQPYLIRSKELGPCFLHVKIGYIRNEDKVDKRYYLLHASLVTTGEVIKNLKLVANIGIDRNAAKNTKDDLACLIGWIIYSIFENFDLDCGVKWGLTSSGTDYSLLMGITVRF